MIGKYLVGKNEIALGYELNSAKNPFKEKDDCGIIQECDQNSVHKENDKKIAVVNTFLCD